MYQPVCFARKCPKCGTELKDGDAVIWCPECGYEEWK